MKLRQKLAAVLAATMVLTAVPVVTMAASTNKVTKVLTVSKNTEFKEKTTASVLKLETKDATVGDIFFLQLENAEWLAKSGTVLDEKDTEGLKVTVNGKKQATVEVKDSNGEFTIPMLVKATGGEATVEVIAEDSAMTGGKYVFAKTAEANEKLAVKVGDMKTLYTKGVIADVTVEELVTGALHSATDEERKITLTLNNSDFEFDYGTATELEVKYGKGLSAEKGKVKVKVEGKDYQTLVIELPDLTSTKARGEITFEELKVKSTAKSPEVGDLTVDVEGKLIKDQSNVKVANVAKYGVTLKMKDDKALEIVAGKAKDAEITLKETIEDSISNDRTAEFRLENGYFAGVVEEKNNEDIFKGSIKVNEEVVPNKDIIIKKVDGVKRAVGFEVSLKDKPKDLDEYKIKASIQTVIGAKDDVTLTVDGRAIGGTASLVVAKAKEDFTVSTKGAKLEVGVKDQKGGEIVIKEADKAALAKGDVITITLADDKGINFTGKPEVETTGEMKVETTFIKADKTTDSAAKVEIKVTRASKEAATITVKDMPVTIDRTVPEGGYDTKITVSGREGKVTGEDFFTIGQGVATKVTTTITNGATEMMVNGAKVTLEAPAFLEKGKMMVPLRAVTEAFGIPSKDIVYSAGNIAIFANGRTISLSIGSTDAFVNGAKMTLANPAKIVKERTTVPVGDLGRLLGLKVEWDNAAKTATFTN